MTPMDDPIELAVDGMSCGHCQQAVEDALSSVPDVDGVEVSLETGTARVTAPGAQPEALVAAVEDAGYEAHPA